MHVPGSFGTSLVPARFARMPWRGNAYEWLLVQTGEMIEAARGMVEKSRADWINLRNEREWDETGWVEPTDPRLHEVLDLPIGDEGFVVLSEAQQLISERTGLSIIADYFTDEWIGPSPNQPPLSGPLWHDLCVLGKLGQYEWMQAGDCLIFHRTRWYDAAQFELPESLIAEYRARLARQGHFTLDDVAELASTLERRPAAGMRGRFSLPRELYEAGATIHPRDSWALAIWHVLSPDERAAAESEQGLRFADVPGRRVAALAKAAWPVAGPFGEPQTPDDRIRGGVFTVRRSEGSDEQSSYTQYDLGIEYPDDPREALTTTVMLREMKPQPADEAATEEGVR
jgi:hypothetical protein